MIETVTTVVEIATNPLVQLGAGALFALGLALFAYAIRTRPRVRDVAQDLADLEAEIEPWVIQAEKQLLGGEAKYSRVLDQAEDWLRQQGITGRRGRLIKKYLPMLIETAVKKVDPKPKLPAKAS